MVKTFEQYINLDPLDPYNEENWEEFAIGDRVISKDRDTYNKKGKICGHWEEQHRFLIHFDDEVWNPNALIGSKINGAEENNIPETHAMWIHEDDLKKIDEHQIYEGLISSVTSDKMLEVLKRNFPDYDIANPRNNEIRITDKYSAHHAYVLLRKADSLNEDKIKPLDVQKIKRIAELLGWFISSAKSKRKLVELKDVNSADYTRDVLNGKITDKIMAVYLERKYDDKLNIQRNKLYHITDAKFINKIKKYGLIPKYAGKRTIHPERIYLCNEGSVYSLGSAFKKYLENPYILEINMKGLNISLYDDVNSNGYYTLDNIPPMNINFNYPQKTFEQYNDMDPYDEENWDDLKFGDRIICSAFPMEGKKGTIYVYEPSIHRFLIYFDDVVPYINNLKVRLADEHKIPQNHALWVNEECLKKIYEE
jgi:hypothetical protein